MLMVPFPWSSLNVFSRCHTSSLDLSAHGFPLFSVCRTIMSKCKLCWLSHDACLIALFNDNLAHLAKNKFEIQVKREIKVGMGMPTNTS